MKTFEVSLKLKTYIFITLLSVILFVSIYQLGYLIANRKLFYPIWAYFSLSFVSYYFLCRYFSFKSSYLNTIAVSSRLLLLFSLPLLSDDIYRFVWDGSLLHNGINPFSFTPEQLMQNKPNWLDELLFKKMNSPAYYSVYPPINQLAFYLSAIPGKGNLISSIVILRVIILLFDFGNIYLIKKLLKFYGKDEKLVFWYALNPLVIIELAGNLHFEAAMIFFTLLAIWFLIKNRWVYASVALGFAVCAKLLPLIFLPLFIHQIGWKKSIYAGLICLLTISILFIPFIHNQHLAENFLSSIQLYYGNFEFNGSIYQILKAIGWKILGYNPIAYTSKILLVLTLIGFLITYLKSKNIFEGIFWLMFIYTIFGAIVHPWYILILIAFTPFVKWRFVIVWSVLICLSYFTYQVFPYQENMNLVILEYSLLVIFIVYELIQKRLFREKLKTINEQ